MTIRMILRSALVALLWPVAATAQQASPHFTPGFIRYHWVDSTAPAARRTFTNPEDKAAIALEDPVLLSIRDIRTAELRDGFGRGNGAVMLVLTPAARRAFATATAARSGSQIAVVIDDRVVTVARIKDSITSLVPVVTDVPRAAAESLVTRINAARGRAGNPVLPGWYADPEAHVFAGKYWIYPTYSAPYVQQTFMDAFSSTDLVTWTKHERIIDTASVKWAWRAMWAPSVVQKTNRYFLFFGANDIQSDTFPRGGGIGVAVSDKPEGPFRDHLGRPLIDKFHNGAQPIDQNVFRDKDGKHYIIYGGWRHCNIAQLNDDFTGFVPFPDGSTFKEITPEGYVEGAYMMLKDGKYYFMWSEGGWTGPNYSVAYAIGDSPLGPFKRIGKILQQDSTVATGAGHHSILHAEGSPNWYIVYHRRPLGERDRNHRVVSIDELHFNADGTIRPVKITRDGVAADPIRR
jgi:hypothetical protein